MAAKVVKTTKTSPAVSSKAKSKPTSKVTKPNSLPKYKDLITEAIVALAERGGSSRQALKSYIKEKYPVGENFDTQFNLAVKRGLESEYFSQPKGPAGSIKLVKKPKAEKPKAEKKSTSATKKPTSTVKKESPAASKKSSGKVTKKVVKKESQKKSDTKKSAVKKAATKKAATKTKKAKK